MFNIYDEVKGLKSIAITGHERPDGDCIGSCLALYLYLKKRMPEADVKVFLQKPSSAFNSIPAVGDIDSSFKSDIIFDAFIVLDSVPDRTGTMEMYSKAGKTINIDHHKSNAEGSSMVNYVVAGASSTAELIYDIIDKEFIDKDIATLIYMGIAHDTGVFRYSSTTPKTLKTVASLVEYGFDFSDLLDNTFFGLVLLKKILKAALNFFELPEKPRLQFLYIIRMKRQVRLVSAQQAMIMMFL